MKNSPRDGHQRRDHVRQSEQSYRSSILLSRGGLKRTKRDYPSHIDIKTKNTSTVLNWAVVSMNTWRFVQISRVEYVELLEKGLIERRLKGTGFKGLDWHSTSLQTPQSVTITHLVKIQAQVVTR